MGAAPFIQQLAFQDTTTHINTGVSHHALLVEDIPWCTTIGYPGNRYSQVPAGVFHKPIQVRMLNERVSEQQRDALYSVSVDKLAGSEVRAHTTTEGHHESLGHLFHNITINLKLRSFYFFW